MIAVTGVLLLIAIAATLADWRRVFFVAILVALVQDPLRKLVPGEPVFYVVLVGVVIAAAVLHAIFSGISLAPGRIRGWRHYCGTPFAFFIVLITLQAFHSLVRFGNPVIPLIGLLGYLTPFIALGLVYQIVLRSSETFVHNFLLFYVICVSLFLSTIALQFLGYDWSILGEVGEGIIIYDQDTIMSAYSGTFRSSEVAAWHAGTAACFLIILFLSGRVAPSRAVGITLLVIAIIGLGVLTGRRKFLVETVVFVAVYGSFLLYFGRGAARLAIISGLIGLTGFVALTLFMPDEKKAVREYDAPYDLYVARTASAFNAVPDRFTSLGLAPIGWAYQRYGLLGAGLGVGTQGVQNFVTTDSGAAEGGLGKIWLELGAPGFLIVAWLGWALLWHVWAILKLVSRQSPQLSRLAFGLAAFLVANAANFSVGTQVYGDIFVLLLLGIALGMLLAMPNLGERALQKRALKLAASPAGVLIPRSA